MNNRLISKVGACTLALCLALPMAAAADDLNSESLVGRNTSGEWRDESMSGVTKEIYGEMNRDSYYPNMVRQNDGQVIYENASGTYRGQPMIVTKDAEGAVIKRMDDGTVKYRGVSKYSVAPANNLNDNTVLYETVSGTYQAGPSRGLTGIKRNANKVRLTDGTVLYETTSGNYVSGNPGMIEKDADGVLIEKDADGNTIRKDFSVMEVEPGVAVRVNNDGTVSTYRTMPVSELPRDTKGVVLYEQTSGTLYLIEEDVPVHWIRPVTYPYPHRPETRQAWGDNAIIPANYMQDPSRY